MKKTIEEEFMKITKEQWDNLKEKEKWIMLSKLFGENKKRQERITYNFPNVFKETTIERVEKYYFK